MSLGFPYGGGGGSGSASMAIGGAVTSGTTGSVLFVGPGPVLTQDNPNFFWDDTNNRLGIGTATPLGTIHASGSSSSTSLTTFDGTRSISMVNIDQTVNNAAGFVLRTADAAGTITTGGKMNAVFTSHSTGAVSADLAFLTNNAGTVSEKMRIMSSGNVGIGTAAPLASFHLAADAKIGTTWLMGMGGAGGGTGAETIKFYNTTTAGSVGLAFCETDLSSSATPFYIQRFGSGHATRASKVDMVQASNANLSLWTNNLERLTVQNDGNVGIGTASPGAQLQITSGAAGTIGSIFKGAASQTADLTEWQNSAGTILGRVDASGFLGIGVTTPANAAIDITASSLYGIRSRGTNTGGTSSFGFYSNSTFASDVTASAASLQSTPSTQAAAYTLSSAYGIFLSDWVLGAGSAITTQYGMRIADQTKGTTNYGIFNQVAFGSNKWGYYGSGTASNYFAGSVGIGVTAAAYKLDINGGSTATQFHISSSSADSGGYLTTAGTDSLYVMGGLAFDGASFIAKAATASMFVVVSGETRWYGNSGLTAGNTYSPTELMKLTTTGRLGIGTNTPLAQLHVIAVAATTGVTVKGAASQTANLQEWQDSSAVVMASVSPAGKPSYSATNTTAGTTGAQTINKPSGTVNFAAAATSLVVTNSLVTTASLVCAVVRTNDTTAVLKNVVPASGSFTITMNAAVTAECSVGFIVFN